MKAYFGYPLIDQVIMYSKIRLYMLKLKKKFEND